MTREEKSVYQFGDVILWLSCQYAAKLDGGGPTAWGGFSSKEDVSWDGFPPFFRFHRLQCQVTLEEM